MGGHPAEQATSLAEQAFSRAAGAPLRAGNRVRILRDAAENYPAWLEAIGAARRYVHFESYIIADDATGERFANAFIERARQGVRVRVLYDWAGCFGRTHRRFWRCLRAAGVEVRCYNPPRLGSPLGWISRDHRKTISVDGEIAYVTGLCVADDWAGDPSRGREPWRDTGVELRGPAVVDVEQAFASLWATLGTPLPDLDAPGAAPTAHVGDLRVRVVATEPATAGMLRLGQLVAALACERVWITDPYFAGTASYIQALSAAARQGVDVRLLVPGATDIPLLRPLSRAGYRPLLEAGVRIFEWSGAMIHAKTGVADGRWSRVGSTNLNPASWLGNFELDLVVEDAGFAREMEAMFLLDLERSTELVLPAGGSIVLTTPAHAPMRWPSNARPRGSTGRVTASAFRVGRTIGAAVSNRRVLERGEGRVLTSAGLVGLGIATVFAVFPRALAYPLVVLLAWTSITLLTRAVSLWPRGADQEGGLLGRLASDDTSTRAEALHASIERWESDGGRTLPLDLP